MCDGLHSAAPQPCPRSAAIHAPAHGKPYIPSTNNKNGAPQIPVGYPAITVENPDGALRHVYDAEHPPHQGFSQRRLKITAESTANGDGLFGDVGRSIPNIRFAGRSAPFWARSRGGAWLLDGWPAAVGRQARSPRGPRCCATGSVRCRPLRGMDPQLASWGPCLPAVPLCLDRYVLCVASLAACSRWGMRSAARVHFGIHQLASPSSRMIAGMSRARMTVASRMIPAARPMARGLIS
jgi:hypothetical protein